MTSSPSDGGRRWTTRLELYATVLMAIAAILTAWSAFESSKWSGVQAIAFSEAGAARVESNRASTRAGQQATVDVVLFTDWLDALQDEVDADPELEAEIVENGYDPDPDSLSGFLQARFRDEFRPAFDEWLEARPLRNPEAPATPFELPSYRLEQNVVADEELARSEQRAADARTANQRSDNYTLTTVAFATVLFFAGMSTKLEKDRNRVLALALALVIVIGAAVTIATFPIEI